MKILLLSNAYKEKHETLIQSIMGLLAKRNFCVSTTFCSDDDYDCILLFNKKKLKDLKNILRKTKFPVIYMFCLSDIASEFLINFRVIDRTIIFRDKLLNCSFLDLFSCDYLEMLPIDEPLLPQRKVHTKSKKMTIYIKLDIDYFDEYILLKFLRLINFKDKYNVFLHLKQNRFVSSLNKHIKVVRKGQSMKECVQTADVVIGSGYVISEAIKQNKKAIVIGERGYGGIITEENIAAHFQNFFQGRNGGKYDECIPINLLERDIERNIELKNSRRIRKILLELEEQTTNLFISLVENKFYPSKSKKGDSKLLFIINPNYSIQRANGKFQLVDIIFGKIHKTLNESECVVILEFQNAINIQDAVCGFPVEHRDEVQHFIKSLIDFKIIIPFAI